MRKLIALVFVVFVAVVLDASCTRHNPLSCCTTDAQCQMFGLDKPYACDSGLVCSGNGTCEMPQCQTSADCTSLMAPVCIGQLCVPSCTADMDCVGIADKPHCASDGACVGCLANSDCGSDAPICDAMARSCRGCTQDSECTGGVCLEAYGTCQADAGVIFVTASGGIDTGTCTRAAPCATFQYALQRVFEPSRNVIHIDEGTLAMGSATIAITAPIYIDGTNTVLLGTGSAALFDVTNSASMVLANATVSQNETVGSGAAFTAFNVHFASALVTTSGGAVTIAASTFQEGAQPTGVSCTNGTTTIDTSTIDVIASQAIATTNCVVAVRRSTLKTSGNQVVFVSGGLITIENSLVVERSPGADVMYVHSGAPGSTVRFNTIVNTSTAEMDDSALDCDASIDATSNIFAYRSMHPITNTGCTTRYSLFDSVALPAESAGVMNKVGSVATFFVDSGAGNYHLAPNSPALMAGEPNLGVTEDLDGKPRPSSQPDVGAFQAL